MALKSWSVDAPRCLSDVVLLELDMAWCREPGVMAPLAKAANLGAVLGLDGAGRYVPYMTELTPAVEASEGVEAAAATYADKAVGVLLSQELPASDEEQDCTALLRGACVAIPNLEWLESVTPEQKTSALAQLRAAGVVPKE